MPDDTERDEATSGVRTHPHLEKGLFKTTAGEAHVGWLVANVAGSMQAPAQYCLDDGSLYQGAPYRLGRVNVFAATPVAGESLNGPAIVYGRRVRGLDDKINPIGPCAAADDDIPVPQMRSDWVADEADWRGHTTRARLAATEYIEAIAVYRLPLVDVRRDGDRIELTLTNPFDQPLSPPATFSLYYEGGPTKPMPIFEPQPLDDLAPGMATTFVAAAPASGQPGRGRKVFRGYRFEGSLGDVRIDLLATVTK